MVAHDSGRDPTSGHNPSGAIDTLESVRRHELAAPAIVRQCTALPNLCARVSYLATGQGDQARIEFQKIFYHPSLAGNYLLSLASSSRLSAAYAIATGIQTACTANRGFETKQCRSTIDVEALAKSRTPTRASSSLGRTQAFSSPLLARAQAKYRYLQSFAITSISASPRVPPRDYKVRLTEREYPHRGDWVFANCLLSCCRHNLRVSTAEVRFLPFFRIRRFPAPDTDLQLV